MTESEAENFSKHMSEISKSSWDIDEVSYLEKCKKISLGLKNSSFAFKSQLQDYWSSISDDKKFEINFKRNKSNSEYWKNMTDFEYSSRCISISNGRSYINQSRVSKRFWEDMSFDSRKLHSDKISKKKKDHFNNLKAISLKSEISDKESEILNNENNRRILISENSKSSFRVLDLLTGDYELIKSVDLLCEKLGCSKPMYKYNLRKKNYIINNYKFEKILN